jgi:hypothetical protein
MSEAKDSPEERWAAYKREFEEWQKAKKPGHLLDLKRRLESAS